MQLLKDKIMTLCIPTCTTNALSLQTKLAKQYQNITNKELNLIRVEFIQYIQNNYNLPDIELLNQNTAIYDIGNTKYPILLMIWYHYLQERLIPYTFTNYRSIVQNI